jgi:hypothetical protein
MIKTVLSRLAKAILLEASKTGSMLCFHGALGKRRLSVNNTYIGDGSAMENIANELALKELVTNGFVVRAPYIERTYKLATEGYILADKLSESAVN